MSARGQKRRICDVRFTSALSSASDVSTPRRYRRFGPQADLPFAFKRIIIVSNSQLATVESSSSTRPRILGSQRDVRCQSKDFLRFPDAAQIVMTERYEAVIAF